ncbi:PBSX family phage terminase large subunit [Photorhabdus luminescens]|uniref:PBSX family phage terminase large subunit n=1 Tax=Photorhabdus luminescens subsp. sonorensis TaxID=1173677 RepID=A0A5C4RIB6_PHOLU|nr:PBSX family phage terminase large subunit [Photorhabdus luminescens]TNH43763.1 PBSX family phage terminase large subunit [Photorhabdus luminescens subsp. sonorensis]
MQTLEKPSLNPALRPFWTTQARNKILYGGRTSSKSWDAAGFAIFLADNYKLRFLCTRQIQEKIEESVYALLKIQINRFNLRHRFRILNNKIINKVTGSEFMFYGLWRHIDEIKSLEGVDVLWNEEAHAMTEAQWEILEPTIRKEGSECWFIFNPGLVTDFVWQNFVVNPPPKTIVRRINYDENPFLSNTIKGVIEAAKLRDPETFNHIYLGVPRSDDDTAVIKLSWVEAAIDAHKLIGFEPSGRKRIGFDVADDGDDRCATVFSHGSVALWCDEWKGKEDELLKSCSRTYQAARVRDTEIIYDSIGVGASAGGKFKELNKEHKSSIGYHKFNAGSAVMKPEQYYQPKVKNKDFFSNLKAQAWWTVADRFRNTYVVVNAIKNGVEPEKFRDDELISISSDIPYLEKLKFELAIPKRDFDNNGRVKVEGKKDLAKRDIKSPNIADAFIMSFANINSGMRINPNALMGI